MKQTITLNNNIQIPIVGLGVYKIPKGMRTQQAVATALNLGYRHIDTAAFYHNEEDVGIAIRKSGIPRKEIFVTTKLHPLRIYNIEKAVKKSLKKLGLDYIDLYLIHAPFFRKKAVWRKLEELSKKGYLRTIGVSNYGIKDLQKLLKTAEITPAVNQVEFHPFLNQKKLREFCRAKNIIIEAHSPLLHGKKINKKEIEQIAIKYDKSIAQILLKWSVQQGNVVLPKSENSTHLKQNIDLFNFTIDKKDMDILNSLNQNYHVAFISKFSKN